MAAWATAVAPGHTRRTTVSRPNHAGRQHSVSVARQIKNQRRGYAQAVLNAVARAQRGRPASAVEKLLRQALTPLGVRLSPAQSNQLARQIEAGQPVTLP
jgi:hypothetical protein